MEEKVLNIVEETNNEGCPDYCIGVDLATGPDYTGTTPIGGVPANDPESTDDTQPINDETAMTIFRQMQQIEDFKQLAATIKEKQLTVVDPTTNDVLGERIKDIDVQIIKKMSKEEIDAIFTDDQGAVMNIGGDITADREFEFKRDFLVYKKESEFALQNLDSAMEEIQVDLKAHEDELNKLVSQFGDLSTFIREKLIKDLEATEDPAKKERFQKMLDSFDDALTLDAIYDNCKKFSTKNTVNDLHRNGAAEAIYAKYVKVLKELRITTDLADFDNLETKFLPEKYHAEPNLFIFIVIKYFAHRKGKATRTEDGILLAQLSLYVRNLFNNSFKDEGVKQTFINSITRILDLYY